MTNFRTCDIILKLSETAANSILKIEQCKVNTTLEIPEVRNNLGEVKKVRKDSKIGKVIASNRNEQEDFRSESF